MEQEIKNNYESDANIMISILHIDRGINCAKELRMIVDSLKNNPQDFDERVARRLSRLSDMMKDCFFDCYDNYDHNDFCYDTFLSKTNESSDIAK